MLNYNQAINHSGYSIELEWLLRLAVEYIIIVTCFIFAQELGPWSWWPIAIILGMRAHALFIIGHMAAHKNCGKLSKILQQLAFIPIGIDINKFKKFHFMYHRNIGISGKDPEVAIVKRFSSRWNKKRYYDYILDIVGLHMDEAITILSYMATIKSMVLYTILLSATIYLFGPVMLLWPIGAVTGLPLVHRARAWTEHDHIHSPGTTWVTAKPSLWKRLTYLPHKTWLHYEHHAGVKGT